MNASAVGACVSCVALGVLLERLRRNRARKETTQRGTTLEPATAKRCAKALDGNLPEKVNAQLTPGTLEPHATTLESAVLEEHEAVLTPKTVLRPGTPMSLNTHPTLRVRWAAAIDAPVILSLIR